LERAHKKFAGFLPARTGSRGSALLFLAVFNVGLKLIIEFDVTIDLLNKS
jgi:hypothetical protein